MAQAPDPTVRPAPYFFVLGSSNGTAWLHQTTAPASLCPDLLRYEQIGEADGPRGRAVRGFFWLLKLWPPNR